MAEASNSIIFINPRGGVAEAAAGVVEDPLDCGLVLEELFFLGLVVAAGADSFADRELDCFEEADFEEMGDLGKEDAEIEARTLFRRTISLDPEEAVAPPEIGGVGFAHK